MDIKKWPVLKSDWLYSLQPKMEKFHTVSKNKTGSRLWLKSWTPYDSKFTLKLKKVGETTRLFRYDLNQISCDYVVKVTNRVKGLDLIDTVPEELWMEVCNIIQEVVIKTIPQEKKCEKAKWLSEEDFTNSWEKKRSESQRRKRKIYTHLNAEFQRIARIDKKTLSKQCKEIEESNIIAKTRYFFKQIRDNNELFHAKTGHPLDKTLNFPLSSRPRHSAS